MQIEQLDIENFRCFKDTTLNLKDRGLLLVEGENRDTGGSNGAGKTSIFEAICWCLFGYTVSGLRGDDVCRFQAKNTRVSVRLKTDTATVLVTRHRKHSDFKNELHLQINGEDARGASDKDTQFRLERLIRLDWNTFISVVMFPQGEQGLASWSDAEQKTVLDQIVGLERFVKAGNKVNEYLKEDQEEAERLRRSQATLSAKLEESGVYLGSLEKNQQVFWNEQRRKVLELQQKIDFLNEHVPQEPVGIQEELTQLEKELYEVELEKNTRNHKSMSGQLGQIMLDKSSIETELELTQQHLDTLIDIDIDATLEGEANCPSCGQHLPEDAVNELRHTLERQQQQITAQRTRHLDTVSALTERLGVLNARAEVNLSLVDDDSDSLTLIQAIKSQISDTQDQLQDAHRQYTAWQHDVNQALAKIDNVQKEENPYKKLIPEVKSRIEAANEDLDTIEKNLKPLLQEIENLKFWKAGFSNGGVKSLMLSTITPYLNERANVYMSELSCNNAVIDIRTQKKLKSGEFRDKLEFKVHYENAGDKYAGKSGGEQRRADLSILFGFGDLASTRTRVPVELRLLDEPFESLDAQGCEQVVHLLKKHVLPKAKTVLVMTHSDDLKSLFEKKIKVVKENGISRIVDED